ncbi:SRPBCC family protein [Microbacterium sp. G2-8]|uniref:SRPBCC family protein n=1 Tax=Microbacterium sp. G2-8 TaxID=2842454 RepID=UPI001C8A518A|nr:SRPBCC family protein [Microbacterium sp. G2-8]
MTRSHARRRWIVVSIAAAVVAVAVVIQRAAAPPRRAPDFAGPAPRILDDGYISTTHSIDIAAPPAETRDLLSDPNLSLEDVIDFDGGFPPVESTEPLIGSWDPGHREGDRRRVRFADGHYLAEQVITDDPAHFRYVIWGLTSPQRFVVRHGVAEFRYEARGDGTRLGWTYSLLPTTPLLAPALRWFVDGTMTPMMRATLDGMRAHVEGTISSR